LSLDTGVPTTIDYHKLILDIEVSVAFYELLVACIL